MSGDNQAEERPPERRKRKVGWLAVLGALVVLGGVYIGVSMSGRSITAEEPNDKFVQVIEKNGCLVCHSSNPEGVWYESIPGIAGIVADDRAKAYRSIDLQALVDKVKAGEDIDAAKIAMVEQSTKNNSMPLASYATVHPGSSLNSGEQQIILNWVKERRTADVLAFSEQYGMGLSSEDAKKAAEEPVMQLPEPGYGVNMEMAMLGLDLYHDTRLSGDNTLACASCHQLSHGGEDGQAHARGITGSLGGVSAPTVYNSVFNIQQFWDGRAADLQEQASGPPTNPIEMGSKDWDEIVNRLKEDTQMVERFNKIFGESGITEKNITAAIAEFEKLLITPNSPFDKYLKGDKKAISAKAAEGYRAFKKYNCGTCHTGAAMGGQSFELLGTVGTAAEYFKERGYEATEADEGRYSQTKDENDKYRFKVPTLRNIELTDPYFHDGSQLSLQQAVRSMFKYQTAHKPSDQDIDNIVEFLNTLTGENEYMNYDFHPSNNLYPNK